MNRRYMSEMEAWYLFHTGANIGAYNMAVDEELLERAQAGENTPVLRLYTWDPPAVSLGRFQRIEESVNADACRRHGFDIVRRVTGGRAVLHLHELTYSITARTDNPFFPPNVLGTYRVIATGLLAGLGNLGLKAEIVARGGRHAALVNTTTKDPACFSSPSWYEIVINGKKIIGSAQRRLANAFLQHGSILISYDPVLEAEVIPGPGNRSGVTSVFQELSPRLTLADVTNAILLGFRQTLGISWRDYPDSAR